MDLKVFRLYMSICMNKGLIPSYESLILFREGFKLSVQ